VRFADPGNHALPIFLWFGVFFCFFCGVKKGARHHRKFVRTTEKSKGTFLPELTFGIRPSAGKMDLGATDAEILPPTSHSGSLSTKLCLTRRPPNSPHPARKQARFGSLRVVPTRKCRLAPFVRRFPAVNGWLSEARKGHVKNVPRTWSPATCVVCSTDGNALSRPTKNAPGQRRLGSWELATRHFMSPERRTAHDDPRVRRQRRSPAGP
jgi:hypothetical protein